MKEKSALAVLYEALEAWQGRTIAVVVVVAIIVLFLFRSSESYGPIAGPFLVGRWEASSLLEGDGSMPGPKSRVLILYDDDVASFDGLKGNWKFADVSRSVVRIEIPIRGRVGPSNVYELQVRRGNRLWGRMREHDKELTFYQMEQGGVVGVVAEAIRAGQERHLKSKRRRLELEERLCREGGWRRVAYATNWWLSEGGPWFSCTEDGRPQRTKVKANQG